MGEFSVISEPNLEFRYGQRIPDPHAGLNLFGPFDAELPSHPRSITYGVVGTHDGIDQFRRFVKALNRPIISREYGNPEEDQRGHLLWPPFPGFDEAFACRLDDEPSWAKELDATTLLSAVQSADPHKRAFDAANFYLEALRLADERDESFGVIFCIEPDEVWRNCRPRSVVFETTGLRPSKKEVVLRREHGDLFDSFDPEQYRLSVDFRRQLKARAMEFSAPIQLVRESTLTIDDSKQNRRNLTVLSDRAWNIGTTAYYKAGGKPWRLASAREGVCYIGFAFKRDETSQNYKTACCAAQMFLDTGDGVVFRGQYGPWYSPEKNEYHLNRESARTLLRGVLDTYHEQGGKQLKEIFLHSRSSISLEEFEGYSEACPKDVAMVGIRVQSARDEMRLYRRGKWPVLRGTVWQLNDRAAYLWGSGFKPTVLSYDGWEVPVPLRIDIQYGTGDLGQICEDILGLTKLNYNACKLGASQPVTILFSDDVGEILVSNPTIKTRRPNFKYYI
jgi:hypothetical protein